MTDWYKIKRVLIRQNGVQKQIYPAWWTPWANTILYVPMEDDLLDHSWNSVSLTQWGTVTLTTLSWVKCASTNVSWLFANFSWDWTNLTITWWIYDTNSWSNVEKYYWALGSNITSWNAWWWSWDNKYILNYINIGGVNIYNTTVGKNSWQLITITKQWTTWKMYKWTTLLGSVSTSYWWNSQRVNLWARLYSSTWFVWYMWGWVVENKTWTNDDVQSYYDLTKSKYGL